MKKIITSLLFGSLLTCGLFAQNFEIRVVEGGAPDFQGNIVGDFRIEIRALEGGAVDPSTSDILTDLSFGIYWADDNIDSLGHACYVFIGSCFTPYTDFLGYDMAPGGYVTLKENGESYMPFGTEDAASPFPEDWVPGEWYLIDVLEIIGTGTGPVFICPVGYPQEGTNWALDPNIGVNNVDYTMDVAGVLPVKLISFQAEKYGDRSALLTWSTVNEINSSYFSVERSEDQFTWKEIGKVKASGESASVVNYEFKDENVYNGRTSSARFFYRLKMVDLDGRSENSNIELVQFTSNESGIAVFVFPNPSTEGVNVVFDYNKADVSPKEILLYNDLGQVVYKKEILSGTSIERVDYAKTNINSGAYTLQVLDALNGIIATEKLIVQR